MRLSQKTQDIIPVQLKNASQKKSEKKRKLRGGASLAELFSRLQFSRSDPRYRERYHAFSTTFAAQDLDAVIITIS